jgi:hypothetical protein
MTAAVSEPALAEVVIAPEVTSPVSRSRSFADAGRGDAASGGRADCLATALLRLQQLDRTPLPVPQPSMDDVEAGGDSEEPDRRIFPRREARGAATIVRLATGQELTATEADSLLCRHGSAGELLDLSRNGIAIVLLQAWRAGERILVRLPLKTETSSQLPTAKVIRSLELGAGLWKVVAQFEQPLAFDDAYELCEHNLTYGNPFQYPPDGR